MSEKKTERKKLARERPGKSTGIIIKRVRNICRTIKVDIKS